MNSAAGLTVEDFVQAAYGFLPGGYVWPRALGGTIGQVFGAAGQAVYSLHAAACVLSETEADPSRTALLLSQWERAFGLPDPCDGAAGQSIALRQAALLARMTQLGGQSRAYFTAVAAALGYTITIEEFSPAVADGSFADDFDYDPEWRFAWQVTAPALVVVDAAADVAFADDPLATWGSTILECVLNRIKPAHTVLLFAYTGPYAAGEWYEPSWGTSGWASSA